MESELSRKIREILEMFGVNPSDKVIGKWYISGHFVDLVEKEIASATSQERQRIHSLPYMQDEKVDMLSSDPSKSVEPYTRNEFRKELRKGINDMSKEVEKV